MNLIIHGFGKMGQMVLDSLIDDKSINVIAIVDNHTNDSSYSIPLFENILDVNLKADVIIDFSHPSLLPDLLEFAVSNNVKLVLATTGFSDGDFQKISDASSKIAIFQSYNMSIGISIFEEILELITPKLKDSFDIEIVEKHHNKKIDAPSGTAKLLYNKIKDNINNCESICDRSQLKRQRNKNEVGISSIRGGTIFGEHTVIFAGEDEVIEIKHEALSKRVFALGSIKAAKLIRKKSNGLYDLKSLYK